MKYKAIVFLLITASLLMASRSDALTRLSCQRGSCYYLTDYPQVEGVRVIYTNGLNKPLPKAQCDANYISCLWNIQVELIYFPTHGALFDLFPWVLGRLGASNITEVTLIQRIKQNLCEMGPCGILFIECHSQGAITTYNALLQLSCEERRRIYVHTYGAAKLIPKCLAACVINYVAENDPVPKSDFAYLSPYRNRHYHVVWMQSPADNNFDHGFLGHSYRTALYWNGYEPWMYCYPSCPAQECTDTCQMGFRSERY